MGLTSLLKLRVGSAKGKDSSKNELGIGDTVPDFELCDAEGRKYKLSSFRGRRVLLSFFRYAACPVCQYSVDRMKQQSDMLARAGIVTICIFNSNPQYIARLVCAKIGYDAIALSDKKGAVYTLFQVKKGSSPVAGTVATMKNWQKYGRYLNLVDNIKDSGNKTSILTQLPADFMINEDGEIVDFLRAETVQDHMAFERVEAFIPQGKRCQCKTKDCLSPRCRKEYEAIKRSSAELLFMG